MENKTEILKNDWGIDLTCFYDAYKNEKLHQYLKENVLYSDMIIEPWSEEDKVKFSNRIYNIVNKNQK